MKAERLSNERHVLLTSDGPGRWEVTVDETGNLIVFGYEGTEIDSEQEPAAEYSSGF